MYRIQIGHVINWLVLSCLLMPCDLISVFRQLIMVVSCCEVGCTIKFEKENPSSVFRVPKKARQTPTALDKCFKTTGPERQAVGTFRPRS